MGHCAGNKATQAHLFIQGQPATKHKDAVLHTNSGVPAADVHWHEPCVHTMQHIRNGYTLRHGSSLVSKMETVVVTLQQR